MKHLSVDIETYSDVDLSSSGVVPYAESDNFEILLFAYSVDFGSVRVVDLANGETLPGEIRASLSDPSVIKHAFNANFEITCLKRAGYETSAEQWQCTMVHSLYCGYPGSLARAAVALGLPEDQQKNRQGAALIRYFSIPCKPTKTNGGRIRNYPEHDPEKWALYKEYNRQDVITEMAILEKLKHWPLPEREQELWQMDARINSRGIPIDRELVQSALAIHEVNQDDLKQEARKITGLANPNSRVQLKDWLEGQIGYPLQDLTKGTVSELEKTTTCEDVRRVLQLRRELSKVSLNKYEAFEAAVSRAGRIHGAHQFYGASRTGRWSGRIIQPQNLPRDTVKAAAMARDLVKRGNVSALRWIYGEDLSHTLSALIRSVIVPSEGNQLIVADYSAIEARVIAWLAGEQWVMDVFAGDGRIYEAAAARMFGVDPDRIQRGNPEYALRQKGKVATLALGYQGGPPALISMGALHMGLSEYELPDIVNRWRQANPNIVNLWRAYEAAAMEVMVEGGEILSHYCTFKREASEDLDYLIIDLPSGRSLFYAQPKIVEGKFGPGIQYQDAGYNGMIPADTYGGKLTENITQAIARDCLAEALKALESSYPVIMHVHDEVVLDVPAEVSIDEITEVMGRPLDWAPGLLLTAEGFATEFYTKD
jgi:DNA polymerase